MKLTLDHTQRLNLHALLGAQRADVGSIRAIWAVQDKLALDADEQKAIDLKQELVQGRERTVWNPELSIQGKQFDFAEAEAARIKTAIETWDGYNAAGDRRWLEPLIEAIYSTAEERRGCPADPKV
jgi:hypothetical protein